MIGKCRIVLISYLSLPYTAFNQKRPKNFFFFFLAAVGDDGSAAAVVVSEVSPEPTVVVVFADSAVNCLS